MPVSYGGGADVMDLAKRMNRKSAPPGWAEQRQQRVDARLQDKYGDQPAMGGKPQINPTRMPGAPVGPTTSPVSPPPMRQPTSLPTTPTIPPALTPQTPPALRPGQPLRPGVQPQPNEPLVTSPYQMPWPTSGPTLFGTGQSPFRALNMNEVNQGY